MRLEILKRKDELKQIKYQTKNGKLFDMGNKEYNIIKISEIENILENNIIDIFYNISLFQPPYEEILNDGSTFIIFESRIISDMFEGSVTFKVGSKKELSNEELILKWIDKYEVNINKNEVIFYLN